MNEHAAVPSPAAGRMRRHRERKRNQMRLLRVELRETEISQLAARGFLRAEDRNNDTAVKEAFYLFLDRTLNG
jgi:hypothetical protein